MPDTKMNMMHTELVWKDIKHSTYKDFLCNIEKNQQMMQGMKKIEIAERDEEGYPKVFYTLKRMPMMTDREGVYQLI